jgi:starch synthase
MKILFVASECVPFCKTGGLADVVGALPKELREKRHDVRIILPKYKTIRGQEFGIKETNEWVRVPMGWGRVESADIRATKTEKGIPVYFINHEGYFGRSGLYRDSRGDYPDNGERFIFFCKAVLEACKAIQFRPDIIHCHDWQTALVPMYLKVLLKGDAFFQHTGSVFTIHNIAYQGIFPKTLLEVTGFSWKEFTMDQFEYYDQISFMKAGLAFADVLNTVSPTYAREIQGSYEFGRGMEDLLRKRTKELFGILNGLDVDDWNPAKDPFLARPFDADRLEARREGKSALQKLLKLSLAPEVPVLGMVARIDQQKGVDLLTQIIPDLMNRNNVQIVVLGQGDESLLRQFEHFSKQYPGNIRLSTDFNDPLAHHIYGGCDLFLMPSRFEPCGLSQMISMRYGAIPIVANTGGLHDTVTPATRDAGTGFLFQPSNAPAFLNAIQEALQFYRDSPVWEALQRRAMSEDFSWTASAPEYLAIYRRALGRQIIRNAKPKAPKPI